MLLDSLYFFKNNNEQIYKVALMVYPDKISYRLYSYDDIAESKCCSINCLKIYSGLGCFLSP